ncbi:MAG: hypothetical protein E7337_15155 [Clostridiales bacterium]|nr:hypothetical protein [Clostridiales bacterium]
MTLLIILAAVLAAYGVWITTCYMGLARMRKSFDEGFQELERQKMLKQNIERICAKRGAELRRLRLDNARKAEMIRELEDKANELNVSMFRESGLRILAEKEEGARRMKMELMERQLREAKQALKEQEEQARGADAMYQSIIMEKDRQIAKLQSAHARRAKARAKAEGVPDQISMDDILGI